MIDETTIAAFAERLQRARHDRVATPALTSDEPGLTLADAYAVQDAGIALRVADGERVIGAKLGFTSPAMRRAMGVDSPNLGWLTDTMLATDAVRLHDFIHPKLEPEIGFILDRDLEGAGVSATDVLGATKYIVPVLEVVDSRFENFRFRPNDNTADNSSAGALVLGSKLTDPRSVDLRTVGVVMSVDGEVQHTAAGAAVAGHPAESVAWLVRRLALGGRGLSSGHLVIAGGLTGPTDLSRGQSISVEIDRLGSAHLRVV